MHPLSVYLPQDRLRALRSGQTLPDHLHGAALFADISGFTPLTESLTQQYGVRRGIEELSWKINAVYDALIYEVEQEGGSVISFAGDSMTCWFDDQYGSGSKSAVGAAMAMQTAMTSFPNMKIKVVVTSGPARRFVVGDPKVQLMDALAGSTVARLSVGEHLAKSGETLMDVATIDALGAVLAIREWRTGELGEPFGLVEHFTRPAEKAAVQEITAFQEEISLQILRPWVIPAIYNREQSGHGLFLTELRPAVALFMRFIGIDYDRDEQAELKLNTLVCQMQMELSHAGGTLLQLNIGDKGSYLYAVFGAPLIHEDDSRRAVQSAIELRKDCAGMTFLEPVQIGISKGIMRCGTYGGTTRRNYSLLGDEVNLAARLMSLAAPGEILLSKRVQKEAGDIFSFEPRPPVRIKGKAEPMPVFALTGPRRQRAIRLEEPVYSLPIMGRQTELSVIDEKLTLALNGMGQIIGITSEAGLGKSRLMAEAIRLALKKGFTGFGGACVASGIDTPYLVWKPLWQALFDLDPEAPMGRQVRHLESEIAERAPSRVEAIPVLSVILDIQLEENAFTRRLEPQNRRNLLAAILEECLKSAADEKPLLLVLEDLHWLDALSQGLLETLARVSASLPVCFVLTYRPPGLAHFQPSYLESLDHFTLLTLNHLTHEEAESLIRAKLAQLFPEIRDPMPQSLALELCTRAEGNPFYIEELLNYLHDRGVNPFEANALQSLDIPDSLHALILSRIDKLSESQQVILKIASIIGRVFPLKWLNGYYPALGTVEKVKADLEDLARLDLTPLETPEPDLAYLFKHIITHEVAYESLPYSTRATLHEQLAQFIESLEGERYLDLLAFHYGLSENRLKQREYFQRAGEAAQSSYANEAALAYYGRLLPLLLEPNEKRDAVDLIHPERNLNKEQIETIFQFLKNYGDLLERVGNHQEAREIYMLIFTHCSGLDSVQQAQAHRKIGQTWLAHLDYQKVLEAFQAAEQALEPLRQADSLDIHTWQSEWLNIVIDRMEVYYYLGETDKIQKEATEVLPLVHSQGTPVQRARLFGWLAGRINRQERYAGSKEAVEYHRLALEAALETEEEGLIAFKYFDLGFSLLWANLLAEAEGFLLQAKARSEKIGDEGTQILSLIYLGVVYRKMLRVESAREVVARGLEMATRGQRTTYIGWAKANQAWLAYRDRDYEQARKLGEAAIELWEQLPLVIPWQWAALWPMIGAAFANNDIETAVQYIRKLFSPAQQDPPKKLAVLMKNIHDCNEGEKWENARNYLGEALRLAAEIGYL